MANYDLLSVIERGNKLKNIRDEIDLCIKANATIASHYDRVMANRDVVAWLELWTNLEDKIEIARMHATAASSQLTDLLLLNTSIYPYFSLQYAWHCGRGGLSAMNFANATGRITFYAPTATHNNFVVPTGEVTADDLIIVENSADNDGIHVITAVNGQYITVSSTLVDEDSTSATVRVIQRAI
jgi:hypothetical protein